MESNKETGVPARDGTMIKVGDTVESVQGTVFEVVEQNGNFYLKRPEGLYNLESYMSPNLWIIK